MKVVLINSVPYGSTGKIVYSLATVCEKNGIESYCFLGASVHKNVTTYKNTKTIGGFFSKGLHMVLSILTGYDGSFSYFATKHLVRYLRNIKPDIVHIHNLHGWYINYRLLFNYLKTEGIRIIWTLHDCWAFTGHCPHYQMAMCNKWESHCFGCDIHREYPQSIFDNSKKMFARKKNLYGGLDILYVTPSDWLKNEAKKSFIKNSPICVINNGIDLSVFKRVQSDVRNKYGILNDDILILGIAYGWSEKKGLDIFVRLSEVLPKRYRIILVGTDEGIDKNLPKSIISIHRTDSQKELVELYSAANIFLNPTREDNYPTVNMEAVSCGCPVITFKTGGATEMITEKTGIIIESNTFDETYDVIMNLDLGKRFSYSDFEEQRLNYDMNAKYKQYLEIYQELLAK